MFEKTSTKRDKLIQRSLSLFVIMMIEERKSWLNNLSRFVRMN